MFVLIASFQSCSAPIKSLIRVFGHTFIKGQSDIRQRDGFASDGFVSTVKAECIVMYAMESVWAIAGRFLITSSAGQDYNWYLFTLFGMSYMEWFMRVNAESLEYLWLVYIQGKPPLTRISLDRYRIAETCSQAQDDAVEQGAIIIVGAIRLFLFSQRAALGLGMGSTAPTIASMLWVVGTQLAVEIPTDIITTAQLIEDGFNVHEYYQDCDEDGVITPHNFMMKVNESCCFGFGTWVALVFFRIAPIPVFCSNSDICSCSFYHNELAAFCGWAVTNN
jgi:hypothetical protein